MAIARPMPEAAPVTIALFRFTVANCPFLYFHAVARIAFVAHCLLNQNAKVDGGARTPGVYSPLVEELRAQGWRIEQMPCPELAFTGLHRFWAVKEQLDTPAFRRHCRRIAGAVASAIEVHATRGDDVVIVGLEGSPSMGVCVTSSDPERGGRPSWPEGATELAPGRGIYIEELEAELADRGISMPRSMGISHQLPDHDPASERAALGELLGG
jgi:predicted secreted protein